ncbi:MAG TPA: NAD-glutamate dehydrogenase [Azoarcus sp.]|nr:NAD-glutamate dehydrogenase [Azoarcus sp.]
MAAVEASDRLISAVLAALAARLKGPVEASIETFSRQWLRSANAVELAERSPDEVCTALLSHWELLAQRQPGETLVRVVEPENPGGQGCPNTVIQIVSDDMPFLVDSALMELHRHGFTPQLLIHPVLCVGRDADGRLVSCREHDECEASAQLESTIYIEVERAGDAAERDLLRSALLRVLDEARATVEDWAAMRERVQDIAAAIDADRLPVSRDEATETKALLEWLLEDHFVFLGCRDYRLAQDNGDTRLEIVPDSGLGLLREQGETCSSAFAALTFEMRAQAHAPTLLTVTKSSSQSTIHRPGYMDYIGVRTFDADGRVCGERRIFGLFASNAYSADPWQIPVLRQKIKAVVERAGLLPGSHADKALRSILEGYPRDELFQIDVDTLFAHANGIRKLGERPSARLFVRCDPFGRFVSCLVFVPREHYDTACRRRIQAALLDALDGESADFDVQLTGKSAARILFTVRTRDGVIADFDAATLERRVSEAARPWGASLREALATNREEALYARWGEAFPAGYRERTTPVEARMDVRHLDALESQHDLGMNLHVSAEDSPGKLRFKLYRLDAPVELSRCLHMLEHMGVLVVDEHPFELRRGDGQRAWIHDFGLHFKGGEAPDIEGLRGLFEEAFLRTWRGEADSDGFNRLVLCAGLSWREVALLRACARYMLQTAFPLSQAYIEQALASYPKIARLLVELFRARFDPQREEGREQAVQKVSGEIEQALETVSSLDEDRILRQIRALIEAMLRTTWFGPAGDGEETRPYIAFKLDPQSLPDLPEPRPAFEVFVTSPRFEAVHMRDGKVARGGLRWSDRPEDFRSEVLGLVKAQIVKNALIVPVGAKGGFVVRRPPTEGGREAVQAEGLACYKLFLSALLDLTDNLVDGQIVPPKLVRHDEDDPYLVVAADKGTATFPDHANAVAAEYDFWLGDAFASGGSVGYDHKKMGITARGAWESVKRHFRSLGRDVQNEAFTAVGIGDMSGDVFGNGALRSKHMRLLAAFDHRHIFIDPDPDAERAFEERARLYELPRSTWDDYDKSLISKGGGVFSRSAKSIELSPEACAALGLSTQRLTSHELIRAILTAPVDLLYNGGIGTYVKASSETDAEVSDRANDSVRVNGGELRCKVVGEGGNLGFTQRGRIEYALTGGHIFTDAIDNSGGVDCSDREVNIKILLGAVVARGELTGDARDALLAEMTDEVASMVLADNYAQGRALNMMAASGIELLAERQAHIARLGQEGRLNRELEALPFDEEFAERRATGQGLVNPELAVLLAHAKIELFDALIASDLPDDRFFANLVREYFPERLAERYDAYIEAHALRREIIATALVNCVVDSLGASFVDRIRSETGAKMEDIVRAVALSREVFGVGALIAEIDALDNQVPAARQSELHLTLLRLVRGATLWWLRNPAWLTDLAATVEHFGPSVAKLSAELVHRLAPEQQEEERVEELVKDDVPTDLAKRVVGLGARIAALDVVDLAAHEDQDLDRAADVYCAVVEALDLVWIVQQIEALTSDSRRATLARSALQADLGAEARRLASEALGAGADAQTCADALAENEGVAAVRYRALLAEAHASGTDLATLVTLLQALRRVSIA